MWHSPLAWQVTLFMGINSLLFYTVNSWLPSILADNGFSAEKAGSLHGLLQLASALPGLILVPLMPRLKDQRLIAFATPCMSLAGFIGLWLAKVGTGVGAVAGRGLRGQLHSRLVIHGAAGA